MVSFTFATQHTSSFHHKSSSGFAFRFSFGEERKHFEIESLQRLKRDKIPKLSPKLMNFLTRNKSFFSALWKVLFSLGCGCSSRAHKNINVWLVGLLAKTVKRLINKPAIKLHFLSYQINNGFLLQIDSQIQLNATKYVLTIVLSSSLRT